VSSTNGGGDAEGRDGHLYRDTKGFGQYRLYSASVSFIFVPVTSFLVDFKPDRAELVIRRALIVRLALSLFSAGCCASKLGAFISNIWCSAFVLPPPTPRARPTRPAYDRASQLWFAKGDQAS
jgi:hypothetical protein